MLNVFQCFMLCSPVHQPLYTLTWKHQSLFHTTTYVRTGDLVGLYTPSRGLKHVATSRVLCQTFISNVTVLTNAIYLQRSMQSSQKLRLSRLMHSVHCDGTVFPYQAFERRPAQEAWTGCDGLHDIKSRVHFAATLCTRFLSAQCFAFLFYSSVICLYDKVLVGWSLFAVKGFWTLRYNICKCAIVMLVVLWLGLLLDFSRRSWRAIF
jgi:hypothetical protein